MIHISAPALVALQRGMAQAPDMVRRELTSEMTVLTQHLEGEVKDAWPVGISNSREQITSDAFSTPTGALGVIGTPSPYAPVIEDGRKPGKGVSRAGQDAIAAWAVGKLGVSPKAAKGVAYLISRKIKAQGIAAKRPFAITLERNRTVALRAFEDAAARIADQLGGAA